MRIGQYRISGASPRFWVILGGVVLLIVALVALRPSGSDNEELLAEPAFPAAELKQTEIGWLDGVDNILTAGSGEEIAENYYEPALGKGQVYRLRVYLPPQDAGREIRSDLYLTSERTGYTFVGGVVLDSTQEYTAESLATEAEQAFSGGRPVQLGFPSDRLPALGEAYEVTGMLWWESFSVSDVSVEEQVDVFPAPTFIVDRYEKLSADELRASSTQVADTSLVYLEGPLELRIPRVEWSAGKELRVCVIVRNRSNAPLSTWQEMLSSMTADIGSGSVSGELTDFSPLSSAGALEPQQTVPSYMVFHGSVADPQRDLILRMRTVMNTRSADAALNSMQLHVPQALIRRVDQGRQQANACTAVETAHPAGTSGAVPQAPPVARSSDTQ